MFPVIFKSLLGAGAIRLGWGSQWNAEQCVQLATEHWLAGACLPQEVYSEAVTGQIFLVQLTLYTLVKHLHAEGLANVTVYPGTGQKD